jgi:TRAP-type C4-dicarboxylate transport system substrate-binding protein
MNQIQEKSVNERKIILSNILAIHVENLTISPSKWEKISEDKRSIFQKLFQDTVMVEGKSMTQLSNINLFV